MRTSSLSELERSARLRARCLAHGHPRPARSNRHENEISNRRGNLQRAAFHRRAVARRPGTRVELDHGHHGERTEPHCAVALRGDHAGGRLRSGQRHRQGLRPVPWHGEGATGRVPGGRGNRGGAHRVEELFSGQCIGIGRRACRIAGGHPGRYPQTGRNHRGRSGRRGDDRLADRRRLGPAGVLPAHVCKPR